MNDEYRVWNILRELRGFCSDHGIRLWACGCCDAINVRDANTGMPLVSMVEVGPLGFRGTVENDEHEYISEGEGYGLDE